MACFIVPAAEAVITTAATKLLHCQDNVQEKVCRKLGWLNRMLWGGSALLAFEHVWHGELTPVFPFLTNAADTTAMLQEMGTSGVGMAALVTGVWGVMTVVSHFIEKREVPLRHGEIQT